MLQKYLTNLFDPVLLFVHKLLNSCGSGAISSLRSLVPPEGIEHYMFSTGCRYFASCLAKYQATFSIPSSCLFASSQTVAVPGPSVHFVPWCPLGVAEKYPSSPTSVYERLRSLFPDPSRQGLFLARCYKSDTQTAILRAFSERFENTYMAQSKDIIAKNDGSIIEVYGHETYARYASPDSRTT